MMPWGREFTNPKGLVRTGVRVHHLLGHGNLRRHGVRLLLLLYVLLRRLLLLLLHLHGRQPGGADGIELLLLLPGAIDVLRA